jgi:hydroxymethylpyrimidine pyrophosphatase-like HAD family hydrolase
LGKPYAAEMQLLEETVGWARSADVEAIRDAVGTASDLPLVAVGSGGSLTAAHFLVGAHRRYARQMACVMTPAELLEIGCPQRSSVWLLSANGANPDILSALECVARQEPMHAAILCGAMQSPLVRAAHQHTWIDVLNCSSPAGRDGFLATNSLAVTCALIARSFCSLGNEDWRAALPPRRIAASWRRDTDALWTRTTLQVLYGGAAKAGAIDLESKFTEAALGNVQLADYRNFAHGRHHWLAKHAATTAVLAFVTKEDAELASRTLALLPRSVPIARIHLPGDYWTASFSSVIAALEIVGWAGRHRGIDPGRPRVPGFGRALYRLRVPRPRRMCALAPWMQSAIERKAGAPLAVLERKESIARWISALAAFSERMREAAFLGVVIDYDGTLVDVRRRFTPPAREVAQALVKLLDAGMLIGIATGRGGSVSRDLRTVLPSATWPLVTVGHYNGAAIAPLSELDVPERCDIAGPELRRLAQVLRADPELAETAIQDDRSAQITLAPRQGVSPTRLWTLVNTILRSAEAGGLQAVSSGHSVDVLAPGVRKSLVLDAVRERINERAGASRREGSILAIGDRGGWPGNDYELLRTPHSLSVDQVSADPMSCWNIAPPAERGVSATLLYLRALRIRAGTARFLWRAGSS